MGFRRAEIFPTTWRPETSSSDRVGNYPSLKRRKIKPKKDLKPGYPHTIFLKNGSGIQLKEIRNSKNNVINSHKFHQMQFNRWQRAGACSWFATFGMAQVKLVKWANREGNENLDTIKVLNRWWGRSEWFEWIVGWIRAPLNQPISHWLVGFLSFFFAVTFDSAIGLVLLVDGSRLFIFLKYSISITGSLYV